MIITKRINLNNHYYYVTIDVEYKKHKDGFAILCLRHFDDDYWDGGDCSLLIKKIEENYTLKKAEKYDECISFMADMIYIYERMPFISGIKEIYISKNDKMLCSENYIEIEEIKKYIEEFNIQVDFNPNFKLYAERTWKI